ncbi:hypothetical protein DPMN_173606 [Dreissena polymorpha]|uniref:Uncharacterized protein n=1 Tax=Dreissena polymorpha TaxID=45954 RepID=A0A9D4E366_DREPO|nr:hypothetical protein DPMN_173606 [Dreissena polymorpha]
MGIVNQTNTQFLERLTARHFPSKIPNDGKSKSLQFAQMPASQGLPKKRRPGHETAFKCRQCDSFTTPCRITYWPIKGYKLELGQNIQSLPTQISVAQTGIRKSCFGIGANRPTDQPTNQQTGQKQYVPHYYSGGHKNPDKFSLQMSEMWLPEVEDRAKQAMFRHLGEKKLL